jgi:iron complex outermembrane receptor protein
MTDHQAARRARLSAGVTASIITTALAGVAHAQEAQQAHTLPTLQVTGSQYDPDDVRPEGVTTATKTYLAPKDIPQTIDTLEVNKYKSYGINDLATMLDGVPGVNTTYDMRGEGVYIRGFKADESDIYRDGVRESGQVRRSTANVERIEILKGPASVL